LNRFLWLNRKILPNCPYPTHPITSPRLAGVAKVKNTSIPVAKSQTGNAPDELALVRTTAERIPQKEVHFIQLVPPTF
jgi:hypothetical protein